MKLTFAIPTWNRSNELKITVYSIAEQIARTGFPAQILISDNCSDDRTPQIIEELKAKWPFIQSVKTDKHGGYSDNFRHVLQAVDTEWCWLFGDDDLLMPKALDIAWEHIASDKYDFICACTDVRATGGNNKSGTLFQLCNDYGFLDTIGFMSSCIFKAAPVKEATFDQSWDVYALSSFVHSCAFLERLGDKQAIILDWPMIGNQESWSEQTGERWASENIFWRYAALDDALRHLWYKGCLPELLKTNFLRYHTFAFSDKMLVALMMEHHQNHQSVSENMWSHISGLADLLADKTAAKALRMQVDDAKRWVEAHRAAVQAFVSVDEQVRKHVDQQGVFTMQYALTSP